MDRHGAHIFADRWIRLRLDGSSAARPVLELPDWVDAIALTAEDHLVLVDQYRHGVRQVRSEFPAGTVDGAEKPLAAARRELLEETGYSSELWHPIGSAAVHPATQTNRIHCFLAVDARRTANQQPDAGEIIGVRELALTEFIEQVQSGRLELPALQMGNLFWLQAFLRRTTDPRLARLRY